MAEDENVERADVTHARVFADALRLPVDGAKALDEDTINTAIQKIFDPATHCSDANVKVCYIQFLLHTLERICLL